MHTHSFHAFISISFTLRLAYSSYYFWLHHQLVLVHQSHCDCKVNNNNNNNNNNLLNQRYSQVPLNVRLERFHCTYVCAYIRTCTLGVCVYILYLLYIRKVRMYVHMYIYVVCEHTICAVHTFVCIYICTYVH